MNKGKIIFLSSFFGLIGAGVFIYLNHNNKIERLKKLPIDYFENQKEFSWNFISNYYKLTDEFIQKYYYKLNWMVIAKRKHELSVQILNKYERIIEDHATGDE